MCTTILNPELNGIELYFNDKPESTIISMLKECGYRWHNVKKCWYAKQNEKTMNTAAKLADNNSETINTTPQTKEKKVNKIASLFERTQWTEESNVDKKLSTKDIAKELRTKVKVQFPEAKFSIRSDYDHIHFYIESSPYAKESVELEAINDYCTALIKSYNYCTCYDPYGDYGSSYSFYGAYSQIDYGYIQTEQTPSVLEDLASFKIEAEKAEQAAQEQKDKEFKEYQKQQEIEHAENLKQEQIRKENESTVVNNAIVTDLADDQQYFISNIQMANCNKNDTLSEYQEQINDNKFYTQDIKIKREINFNDENSFNLFCNMLLSDFDFLAGFGGSYTDDRRVTSMTDYEQMEKTERETIKFILEGLAIKLNNELQFIVDPEGYSYARYVGLINNATIEKSVNTPQAITEEQQAEYKTAAETIEDISTDIISDRQIIKTWSTNDWTIYKEIIKEQLNQHNIKLNQRIVQQISIEELKVAMYRILVEVDGIQEQFERADIQQGQKVTLFYIGDMGGLITSYITVDSVTNTTYAQYNDVVKITFKQPRKHGLYYKHFYGDMLVYNGWIELPITVLHNVTEQNGFTCTQGKFSSCDKQQYDAIIEYFKNSEQLPIVNTYKPIF